MKRKRVFIVVIITISFIIALISVGLVLNSSAVFRDITFNEHEESNNKTPAEIEAEYREVLAKEEEIKDTGVVTNDYMYNSWLSGVSEKEVTETIVQVTEVETDEARNISPYKATLENYVNEFWSEKDSTPELMCINSTSGNRLFYEYLYMGKCYYFILAVTEDCENNECKIYQYVEEVPASNATVQSD